MGCWIILFIVAAISALFEGKPLGVFVGIVLAVICYAISACKQKAIDKKYEKFKYRNVERPANEDEPVDSRHII